MTASLDEKTAWIERFFKHTGPTYDEVVNRFTLGIDRLWKKKILSKFANPKKVLDLACGTGILTFSIKRKYPESKIIGVDISEGYLKVARFKALKSQIENVSFIRSRAEAFVSEDRFDVVTSSYLPKYADLPLLMRNLNTMLIPGGNIVFHDFTYPSSRFLQGIFELYFICIQPLGGWWYPEWKAVFKELPEVIRHTSWVNELRLAMEVEGFTDIQVESLTLQGAAIVSGKKKDVT